MTDVPTIRVRVLCFAAVREALGEDRVDLDVPAGTTVEQLQQRLGERAPRLQRLQVAFAVNQGYARGDRVLQQGDEVALVPPISGGSGKGDLFRFELCDGAIDPRAVELEVRTDRDGAVVTFAGTTRNHNDGAAVTGLAYEAYAEMAQKVMGRIFEEAVKRFPITRARVVHRLGEVPVGETSVLVVVAAEHRASAFEACRFLIDRLKDEVPIWKRERLAGDGGERWVGQLPRPPQA
ncbi:MAG: molybdopterin converting factor subunit 1 [Planctomycetota bacterium]